MKQHTLIARELLAGAPEYWRFTPVGDAKVPVDPKSGKAATGWQNNPYSLDQICSMNGVVKAVGLMTGVVSQTMAIDFDGPGSNQTFEQETGPCPVCAPLDGRVERRMEDFPVPYPVHPRCRCGVIPATL